MYLTTSELSNLIECQKNSYTCMRRWLDKNGWPYAVSITGFPKVTKEYHDTRMSGMKKAAMEQEPNFGAIIR